MPGPIQYADGIAYAPGAKRVAGEGNNKLAVFDLTNGQVLAIYPVGKDPDVLTFDPGLKLLYVSAESGDVRAFQENGKSLKAVGQLSMPHEHGCG